MTASLASVIIPIQVNVFNVLKFILVEFAVSCVLETAWEMIISRTAHARIVRGERVTLNTLTKSRTFPGSLHTGRLPHYGAVVLSLLTLGGSLSSEYAVGSLPVTVKGTATAPIYSRGVSRNSVDDFNDTRVSRSFKGLAASAAVMANRCYYRDPETGEYFVNATFADATDAGKIACVSNAASRRFPVSDVCVFC